MFKDDVNGVLNQMVADDRKIYDEWLAKPESERPLHAPTRIFNFKEWAKGAEQGFRIINPDLYFSELIGGLQKRGFCAINDGEELAIKKGTNSFSEQWDVYTAEAYSIRAYKTTCYDAAF